VNVNGEGGARLVVGVLGMPDNEATVRLLDHLDRDAHVDFVVYWRPAPRDQWRRLVRKVRADGVGPAVQRVAYAVLRSRGRGDDAAVRARPPWREYTVPGHNSTQCREALVREGVDVLVLSTDAIIGSRILEVPRVMTLNGHPGWIPQYRGLGANLFQMEAGRLPAVSVHAVNEGIDTGPLLVRETVAVDPAGGLPGIEQAVERRRLELLAETIRRAERDELRFVDTFCEPSGMTRGMSRRRRNRLDERLRSGRLRLS
jgi:folate-dependent phosphoribosylglycinamide formyltransferase PurN